MHVDHLILQAIPKAVTRLGEDLFLKVPLYQAKDPHIPIYINHALFKKYIPLYKQNYTWDNMCRWITTNFSLTLNIKQSKGIQIGFAYVDKQADPSHIALQGNTGSGRAFYVGSIFNIKGEKTPCATSSHMHHASGILPLSDALKNTISANGLYADLEYTLSPILAIVVLERTAIHPIHKNPVQCAHIIRLDIEGSLDRITHYFYKAQGLSPKTLHNMAKHFGQLEAKKIIHRVLHGSWSSGNISPTGHLIDFDSVCTVKHRIPQFSQSSYYIENYFSFEYLGKCKVLTHVLQDPALNTAHVTIDTLKKIFFTSRNQKLRQKWPHLMGFISVTSNRMFTKEMNALIEAFLELCRYIRYKKPEYFFVYRSMHFEACLYDFSTFFRYFPLLKLNNQYTLERAYNLLFQTQLEFKKKTKPSRKRPALELSETTWEHITPYYVHTKTQQKELAKRVFAFIASYNSLFDKMLAQTKAPLHKIAMHAYAFNEERFYLLPIFNLSTILAEHYNKTSIKTLNRWITSIIEASKRTPRPNNKRVITDLRLFVDGRSYIEIHHTGFFNILFHIEKAPIQPPLKTLEKNYTIAFQEENYRCTVTDYQSYYQIASELIPIDKLLVIHYARDRTFLIHLFTLKYYGVPCQFEHFYGAIPSETGYYF